MCLHMPIKTRAFVKLQGFTTEPHHEGIPMALMRGYCRETSFLKNDSLVTWGQDK